MEQMDARARDGWTIALVACATLVYEVLLTRVSSLRLEFHYGYLVISLGLLALGSAGSLLHALRPRVLARPRGWIAGSSVAFAFNLPVTWAFLIHYPVPTDVRVFAADGGGVAWGSLLLFFGFAAGAAAPFFLGGLVIGLILMLRAARADRYYAADLAGAALGCLAAPLLLAWSGGGGALCGATALAFLGAFAAGGPSGGPRRWPLVGAILSVALLPLLEARLPIPSREELMMEKGEAVALGEELLTSDWSAIARVESYRVDPDERRMFMRSHALQPSYAADQVFLAQDGSAGTYLFDFSGTPEGLEDLWLTTYPLGTHVLGAQSVLIIGAGGAPDLWGAKLAGAERAKAFELHRQIVDLHQGEYYAFSKDLIDDPGFEIVHAEGRSALLREEESYDLFQMSGIDTWSALSSGAYMLAENYLYTQEAFADMFAKAEALQVTRFSGDVEALRLLATIHGAWLDREGADPAVRFEDCVASIHARDFMAMLVKKRPFTESELARLDGYVERAQLGLAYRPGASFGNAIEAFVRSPDKQAFVASARANVTPSTDDCPYFFNFNRWHDFATARATLDSGSTLTQGNPLFILAQLLVAVLAGVVLLVGPLLLGRRGAGEAPRPRGVLPASALYFSVLGLGFIAIEVTLMQQLVLLVGHPLYSISVTLFAMLLATGAGSFLSPRLGRAFKLLPVALLLLALAWAFAGEGLVRAAASADAPVRFALAAGIVLPFGLLLGVPMAHGLRRLEATAPALVPWAWATNAFATVAGSILTVIASMNFGFRWTLLGAAALYLLAAWVEPRLGGSADSNAAA